MRGRNRLGGRGGKRSSRRPRPQSAYLKPLRAVLGVELLEFIVVATGLASERGNVRDQDNLALGRREVVLGTGSLTGIRV